MTSLKADPIFQKGLQDLIKGIRSHKKDPSEYISQAIADIKNELKSTDPYIKAEAVRKLTYLQMLGYNVSWASFAIVEVMSQSRFAHKRIGYQAANQSFNESTDVILLTTNLFKKEFVGGINTNQYEIGIAINCIANIATKDLARDCMPDLVALMNHSKPYIRKKAVLAMYKLYVKFPQGLRLTFDKLKEKLDDPESSVVSTAVNVICELANKNPKNYLTMAPKLFRLLTTSSNNWMLIKVVKLLGSLVTEEPRLARKLLEPLATIIQNTAAKSLQYECIYTVTEALPHSKREDGSDAKNAPAVVKICSDYLKSFIEDSDQNLKYLGLVGLVKLMKSSPRSVVDHRDLILKCLNDDDITIRTRSLELLVGIVSRKSLMDLVRHLIGHAKYAEGSYRDEIISKILFMCKKDKYSLVDDFAWYASILLELAVMQGSKHGSDVANQLIEISLRVDTVRPFAVDQMLAMLLNNSLRLGQAHFTIAEVLKAAAWIIGEYSDILTSIANDTGDEMDEDEDDENAYWIEGLNGEDFRSDWRGKSVHVLVMDALLNAKITNLPPHVQTIFIQSALKVFVRASLDCSIEDLSSIIATIRNNIHIFMQNQDLEVQERATSFRYLLSEFDILPLDWEASEVADESKGKSKKEDINLLQMDFVKVTDENGAKKVKEKKDILASIIAEKFYTVHSKAQKKVPVPDDIDLSVPFDKSALNKLLSYEIPDDLNLNGLYLVKVHSYPIPNIDNFSNDDDVKMSKLINTSFSDNFEDNLTVQHSHISGSTNHETITISTGNVTRNSEDIFMLSSNAKVGSDIIPLSKILEIPGKKSKSSKSKKKGSKSRSKTVDVSDMLPAGAGDISDDDEEEEKLNTRSRRVKFGRRNDDDDDEVDLNKVDITTPLASNEVFAIQTHRVVENVTRNYNDDLDGGKKKHKKKSEKTKKSSSKSKKVDLLDISNEDHSSSNNNMNSNNKPYEVDNLLGLDWNVDNNKSEELVTTKNKSKKHDVDTKKSNNSKEKETKKSTSGNFWIPAHSNQHIDLFYSTTVNGNKLGLSLKAVNHSSDNSAATLSIKFLQSNEIKLVQSNPNYSSLSINIADHLSSGKDTKESITIDLFQPISKEMVLSCTLAVILDTLLGTETSSTIINLKIPLCASFVPNEIDENVFSTALSKKSSRWADTTIQLSTDMKSKAAFKAIGGFLKAHIIESETSGKAVSMSSKTTNGDKIYILAKSNNSNNTITVDIKCIASTKDESVVIADSIAKSLSEIF